MKNEFMLAEFVGLFEHVWCKVSGIETPEPDYIYQMVVDEMWEMNEWITSDFKELDEYYWGNKEDLVNICLGAL